MTKCFDDKAIGEEDDYPEQPTTITNQYWLYFC